MDLFSILTKSGFWLASILSQIACLSNSAKFFSKSNSSSMTGSSTGVLNAMFLSKRRLVFFLSILLNASCCATVGALGFWNAPLFCVGAVISIGWLAFRCSIIGVWPNLLLLLLMMLLALVFVFVFVCALECAIFTSTFAGIKFPNAFLMLIGDLALKFDFWLVGGDLSKKKIHSLNENEKTRKCLISHAGVRTCLHFWLLCWRY